MDSWQTSQSLQLHAMSATGTAIVTKIHLIILHSKSHTGYIIQIRQLMGLIIIAQIDKLTLVFLMSSFFPVIWSSRTLSSIAVTCLHAPSC
jgi:hypothetical protein